MLRAGDADGFAAAMREAGLPVRDNWVCTADLTEQSGYLAMQRILGQGRTAHGGFPVTTSSLTVRSRR